MKQNVTNIYNQIKELVDNYDVNSLSTTLAVDFISNEIDKIGHDAISQFVDSLCEQAVTKKRLSTKQAWALAFQFDNLGVVLEIKDEPSYKDLFPKKYKILNINRNLSINAFRS